MPRNTPVDYEAAPNDALAKWVAQRYAAQADYENLLNERENQILALSEASGPRSDKYLNAKKDLDRAEHEYERINANIRRPLSRWELPFWVLVAFALALAFFEAPVNKFLFDVALQSSNLTSWTISFGFACALLLLAHVAGFSLRQIWSSYRKRIVWSSLIIFILMIGILFVLVSILTVARASFAAEAGTIRDLLSEVRTTIQSAGVWGALRSAFSNLSALVLATVNIGGIFMTTMLSFFKHVADKDFDAVATTVERRRKHLAKIVKDFVSRKSKIVKDFAPDLAGHGAVHKTANMNIIELKKRLGHELEEEDRHVIDRLDTMAEESEHWRDASTETTNVVSAKRPASASGQGPNSPTNRREPTLVAGERREAG
jgi:hypothetical protein